MIRCMYVGDEMAADEGGPPVPAPEFVHIIKGDQTYDCYKGIKKEQEFDSYNNNNKQPLSSSSSSSVDSNVGKKVGISIAERRAAKCGFNASNINKSQLRSIVCDLLVAPGPPPCFTIPSGISPSTLLDSPVMLPNAQAQQSPTTGTFQFSAPNHHASSKLKMKSACNEANSPIGMDQSSLSQHQAQEFKHFVSNDLLVENKLPFEEVEYPKDLKGIAKHDCNLEEILAESTPVVLGNTNNKFHEVEYSSMQHPSNTKHQMAYHNDQSGKERSIQPHHLNQDKYQKEEYFPNKVQVAAKYSEDGFYWRKYGQKHVKGSEYPRSYYKCTNTYCSVRKKVERSHDGQITEIVYKGSHNHPKPKPYNYKRSSFGEMTSDDQMNNEGNNGSISPCLKTKCTFASGGCFDWRCDGNGSSSSFLSDISDPAISRSTNACESIMDTQEFSSALGNSQDGDGQTIDDASPDTMSFNDEDDENGECEPKKRKRDSLSSEIAAILPRSIQEPRVVVQIESDIDILDDGYRWRKYGQKVVKGNPNPRSYYKCTTPGCLVRKHIERAANDIKSVITTYEGKHNHDVPSTSKIGGSLTAPDVAVHVANNNTGVPVPAVPSSSSSQMVHKTTKAGKQLVQDHNLPLYLDRKPILNYNELLLRSNLSAGTNLANDLLHFGTCCSSSSAAAAASAVYPLSFPSFHSLPYGSSLLMNGDHNNHSKSSPSPLVYPMFPKYLSLPPSSQMDQVPNMPPPAPTFNFSNYSALQPPAASVTVRGHEIRDVNAITLKPKEEEQHRDDGEPYSTNSSQLSMLDHGTPTGTTIIN